MRTKRIAAALLSGILALGSLSLAVSAEEKDENQVLNLRKTAFGNNYDVQDMGWRWMMAACYDGLYRNVADENGEHFILAGAESVDVSEDGTVYTYHLRENAKWSDGQPVTAHDYEYGWKRLLNPEYMYDYAFFIYNVVGAEEYNTGEGSADDVMAKAIDDYTFEVTLKIPDATFESKLVATPLYPTREDIAEAAGENWGKDWTLCVYNGPFCMSELVEDNKMVWTKNEYYWDAENVSLDTINWFLIQQDSTAVSMFDNGELDVLETSGDYSILYKEKAANGEVQLISTDYPGTVAFAFNFPTGGTDGMMSNVKIRKAISYSFDREEMIEGIFGRYKPALGWVAPAITFNGQSYRAQFESPITEEYNQYVNDPEALQALFKEGLAELGIEKDLSEITITYLDYGSTIEDQSTREYVQQILNQKLGINVELNSTGDYGMFTAERDEGNYDLMFTGWYSDYNDPLDFMQTVYTGIYDTYGSYSNPAYDELIDALTGENDLEKRLQIYEDAETLFLLEDCGIIPIYYSTKECFVQNWVKNFRTSSFGASLEPYIAYIEGRE